MVRRLLRRYPMGLLRRYPMGTTRRFALSIALVGAAGLAGCPPSTCCVDEDGDQYCGECGSCGEYSGCRVRDCDDDDPTIHPYRQDPLDGVDRDCDGHDLGGTGAKCESDAECHGACTDNGTCTNTPETCNDGVDQDGDDRIDCADLDCAEICKDALAQACAAPPVLVDSASGSFADSSDLIAWPWLCTSEPARDRIFRLTQAESGVPGELSVTSNGDQTLAALDRCAPGPETFDCVDGDPIGGTRPLWMAVSGDTPAWLLVQEDTFGSGGAFQLSVDFTAAICGDGEVVLPEACDDGNTSAGDGCDDACQPEAGFDPCATAEVLEEGVTQGTTAWGTTASEGSCGGAGREKGYLFLPAASGQLELRIVSPRYVTMYARQSCALASTEIGCVLPSAGSATTLSVPVAAGVVVYVIVDAYEVGPPATFELSATMVED
jgi:cysteine-rich repeat protein